MRWSLGWAFLSLLVLLGCAPAAPLQPATPALARELVVYSGRSKELVGPLLERFTRETGVEVKVRYGDTAELAAAILEEGRNTPADAYFAQDAGALGALSAAGRLTKLPEAILSRVEERFRSPKGDWVGLSGRARTVVYNTKALKPEDLPDSILGFADPRWKGKIGWPPTNGSFQGFVTALRITEGEEAARRWLAGIQANNPKVYRNNTAVVQAVGAGEVEVGFVNHYYLFRFLKEQGEAFPARNYHPRAGDAGALINVAGAGILDTSKRAETVQRFLEYLLSPEAQQYFAEETFEYPLIPGVKTHPLLITLSQIRTPKLDLGSLEDLKGTLKLLQAVGIL